MGKGKIFYFYVINHEILKKIDFTDNFNEKLLHYDDTLRGTYRAFEKQGFDIYLYYRLNFFLNPLFHKYRLIHYANFVYLYLFNKINNYLIYKDIKKIIDKENLTLFYTGINPSVSPKLLNYLKKNQIKSVQWFGLLPSQLKNKTPIKNTPLYDLTVSGGNILDLFPKKYKPNFLELFCAYNPAENKIEIKKHIDVLFIGGLRKIHSNRWDFLEHLHKKGIDISIYAYGTQDIPNFYEFKKIIKPPEWGPEYDKLIKSAKIALNFFLNDIDEITSGVNKRVFEILSNETLMISKNFEGLNKMFSESEEFISFDDKEDLFDKVSYYLINEEQRNLISINGKKATKKYSYDSYVKKLLNYLNLKS